MTLRSKRLGLMKPWSMNIWITVRKATRTHSEVLVFQLSKRLLFRSPAQDAVPSTSQRSARPITKYVDDVPRRDTSKQYAESKRYARAGDTPKSGTGQPNNAMFPSPCLDLDLGQRPHTEGKAEAVIATPESATAIAAVFPDLGQGHSDDRHTRAITTRKGPTT